MVAKATLAATLLALTLPVAHANDAKAGARGRAVPAACQATQGVERKMCIECGDAPIHRRIGCEQRVFWTTCKGKRLINDPYCKTHQDKGPPAAVQ
jgi:hypothetical protein